MVGLVHGFDGWWLPAAIDDRKAAVQALTLMAESEVRRLPAIRLGRAAKHVAAILTLVAPALSLAEALVPSVALDRYVAERNEQPACSDSLFAVQIDASMPALKKRGSMSGFKRIVQPGEVAYRGLRFTGDKLIKTQVIARFLAHDAGQPAQAGDTAVTPANFTFAFDRASDYNGLAAYVFLLKPRRRRAGLFRGELWLDAETAAPLRLWGDLVKTPSIFIRSLRFVQDYQTVHGCTEPLRLLLSARTRIAGSVEMTVWMHPASEKPEATQRMNAIPDFSMEANLDNEHNNR